METDIEKRVLSILPAPERLLVIMLANEHHEQEVQLTINNLIDAGRLRRRATEGVDCLVENYRAADDRRAKQRERSNRNREIRRSLKWAA